MFVIGRGTEFATAREIALKLIETCRVAAEPLTATQLAHGPVAALDSLFPVWAIASRDETLPSVTEAAGRIQAAGATLLASGTAADAIVGADHSIPIPMPSVPLLAPILSVVPGQLFAWALARAKGLDPDVPRGPEQGHAGPLSLRQTAVGVGGWRWSCKRISSTIPTPRSTVAAPHRIAIPTLLPLQPTVLVASAWWTVGFGGMKARAVAGTASARTATASTSSMRMARISSSFHHQ